MEIRGNKIIFKALVGSHSHGTNIEGSDEDYKGVFVQSPEDVLEHGYTPQIDVGKDETYYEVGRFMELLSSANPTMLELLYAPRILHRDGSWDIMEHNRHMFLTKQCRHSFGGYAISQIKKASGLEKKMNWEKEDTIRRTVDQFCYVYPLSQGPHYSSKAIPLNAYLKEEGYDMVHCGLVNIDHMRDCYVLFCDDLAWLAGTNHRVTDSMKTHRFKGICTPEGNDVVLSDVPVYVTPRGVLYFNKDAYSIHCRKFREYTGWLKNRNTQRYVDIEGHGQQIDGKNLLHCVRLIETGLEIATMKTVNVLRPNAEYLVEIRKGKHDLASILTKCESDLVKMDEAFETSDLPDVVDEDELKEIVKEIRKKYYELGSNT